MRKPPVERCQKPSGTFIKIITTFRQSLRNAFAAACFAFADPLHPTTSLANPFAEFLLLTSKKSISKGESFLICNHCFRHIFANLSPTFRLVIMNLWMTCFVLKTSSPTLSQQNPFIKKSEPFSKPFAKLFPNCSFPFAQIHNLKSYLNSFIEVYDVAQVYYQYQLSNKTITPTLVFRVHLRPVCRSTTMEVQSEESKIEVSQSRDQRLAGTALCVSCL